jgi:hypothetical protein
MAKDHGGHGKKDDIDVTKYYIIQHPTRLSNLSDEMEDYAWRDQSRQLQARRWRKLRHQVM